MVETIWDVQQEYSLSLLPETVKEIERVAREDQKSRSQLMRGARRLYLEEREWRRLQAYGRKKAAEQGLTPEDVERLVHEVRSGQ